MKDEMTICIWVESEQRYVPCGKIPKVYHPPRGEVIGNCANCHSQIRDGEVGVGNLPEIFCDDKCFCEFEHGPGSFC